MKLGGCSARLFRKTDALERRRFHERERSRRRPAQSVGPPAESGPGPGRSRRRAGETAAARESWVVFLDSRAGEYEARRDLEAFLSRLVPDGDPAFTHVAEGADDMPSHVKAALTRTSEQILFRDGALLLGTWQGVYVWEHRRREHEREVVVHLLGE